MDWKYKTVAMVIFAIMTLNVHAQKKDTVYLVNGQVLVGDIKMAQMGELIIDEVDFRKLEIKMYKIIAINTYTPVRLETHNKEIFYGILKRSEKKGWTKFVREDGEEMEMDMLSINSIAAVNRKFFAQLDGNFSAGFSYSKSSSLGQLNLSSNTKYTRKRSEYYLTASMIASIDSNEFSRDRENASIFASYNISPAWFVGAGFDYERNLELSIASRLQELIGVGNKIVLKRTWELSFLSGLTFNQEKSTSGTSSGLLLEIPAVVKFNFFKYRHPNIQINNTQSVFFSLSQKGRVRYDTNFSFSWEIIRRFYFTLNPYFNYDNQPPEGNNTSDFGIAVSLSYQF